MKEEEKWKSTIMIEENRGRGREMEMIQLCMRQSKRGSLISNKSRNDLFSTRMRMASLYYFSNIHLIA